MKFDFIILGASGIQGRIVTRDLAQKGYRLLLADLYKDGSEKNISQFSERVAFKFVDLRKIKPIIEIIKYSEPKVIINCAEGDWNMNVYKAALKTKTHVVDLGSRVPMTKDQLEMHEIFKKADLTAITGCGSTPGINNIMLSYASKYFDSIHTVNAGFVWDSNIKKFVVPFSIESIIEEFTWPAPIIEDGKWKRVSPLKTIKEGEFRAIGKQNILIVDHPETMTFYHYFKSQGLRNVRFYAGFPEHSTKTIMTLIDLGLHSTEKIKVDGPMVSPSNLLTRALSKLDMPKGYVEKENLWVEIIGEKDGQHKMILMECIVPTLPGWEEAGCNIDTGLPTAVIAEMIRNNVITERGSFAPEAVVPEEDFFKELAKYSMVVYRDGAPLNAEYIDRDAMTISYKKVAQVGIFK